MSDYTQQELLELAAGMRRAAMDIYPILTRCNVHPFVEFNGLMQKYVDICENAARAGIEFPLLHEHSGRALPIAPHDMLYLAEKLRCIFGPALDSDPAVRTAFMQGMFGESAPDVLPSKERVFGVGVKMTPNAPFARLYIQEECLTNIPVGKKEPDPGEPWATYLLGRIDRHDGPHCVVTISAETNDERNELVARFVNRDDVTVMDATDGDDD